jgi:hypothetical protein
MSQQENNQVPIRRVSSAPEASYPKPFQKVLKDAKQKAACSITESVPKPPDLNSYKHYSQVLQTVTAEVILQGRYKRRTWSSYSEGQDETDKIVAILKADQQRIKAGLPKFEKVETKLEVQEVETEPKLPKFTIRYLGTDKERFETLCGKDPESEMSTDERKEFELGCIKFTDTLHDKCLKERSNGKLSNKGLALLKFLPEDRQGMIRWADSGVLARPSDHYSMIKNYLAALRKSKSIEEGRALYNSLPRQTRDYIEREKKRVMDNCTIKPLR